MDYLAVCPSWVIDASGAVTCNGELSVIPVSELLTRFSLEDLDPAMIAQAFGAGFILVAIFMASGHGIRALLRVIKMG